jgi:hypothetical protein
LVKDWFLLARKFSPEIPVSFSEMKNGIYLVLAEMPGVAQDYVRNEGT